MARKIKEEVKEEKTTKKVKEVKPAKKEKAAKEKPVKEKTVKRGREAGVRYEIGVDSKKALNEALTDFEESCEMIKSEIVMFIAKGNASAARRARKKIQEMVHMSKPFRKLIQDAKESLNVVSTNA